MSDDVVYTVVANTAGFTGPMQAAAASTSELVALSQGLQAQIAAFQGASATGEAAERSRIAAMVAASTATQAAEAATASRTAVTLESAQAALAAAKSEDAMVAALYDVGVAQRAAAAAAAAATEARLPRKPRQKLSLPSPPKYRRGAL